MEQTVSSRSYSAVAFVTGMLTMLVMLVMLVMLAMLAIPAAESMAQQPAKPGKNPFRIGRPLVIPHAGGDSEYPENTMIAWERSMAAGGDVVDIDVSMTADKVLVALHDSTVERTTNGSGKVSEMSFQELRKLDAGWKFKRQGKYPYRKKNVRIPTIQAVLAKFPTSLVTLDLKDLTVESATQICRLLTELKRADTVYVGVDTTEQVLEFRRRCPEVRTSGTDDERRAARAARESGDTSFVSSQLVSQPSYRAQDGTKRVTSETLAFSHSHNTAVLTWVVDDEKSMSELIDLGVDGIYTRRPEVMLKLLRKKGKL
jgi:glycerophosphoryl diester phosphodiesterase